MFKKMFTSLIAVLTISFSALSIASAQDYWLDGKGGYNYYVVSEKSGWLDDKAAVARVKEVSPSGSVYPYDLYMWEMKGELWYSTRKADLWTRNGRIARNHSDLAGKAYDFIISHY